MPIYLTSFAAVATMSFAVAFLPLYASNGFGAPDATVGAVLGMQGLGSISVAACAGVLVGRIGERCGMIVGAAVRVLSYTLLALSGVLGRAAALQLLFVGWLCEGVGMGTYQIARQAYMAAAVPKRLRGRANGLIGGCARLAQVIGPASGSAVVTQRQIGPPPAPCRRRRGEAWRHPTVQSHLVRNEHVAISKLSTYL